MRVVIARNAHADTRGTSAPELVRISVAARLVDRQTAGADPEHLDNATSVGRDILTAIDMIPGIDSVRAERHRLHLEIARAFDADAVVAEVLAAIGRAVGEPVGEA
jgi:hypothetical protein